MKSFLAEHLSIWGGMFCLAMYVYTNSVYYAIGFIVAFIVNTFFSLYKHAQFTVFTQEARDKFEEEYLANKERQTDSK